MILQKVHPNMLQGFTDSTTTTEEDEMFVGNKVTAVWEEWEDAGDFKSTTKLHVCIEHIRSCREWDTVNRNAVVQF